MGNQPETDLNIEVLNVPAKLTQKAVDNLSNYRNQKPAFWGQPSAGLLCQSLRQNNPATWGAFPRYETMVQQVVKSVKVTNSDIIWNIDPISEYYRT